MTKAPTRTLEATATSNPPDGTEPKEETHRVIAISIESQKGGVGKTTVALNVAKLLLQHYHVLFFDLDVAGTEAASVSDSPFWKDDTEVVAFSILKEGPSRTKKEKSTNLVELYCDFMAGTPLPRFRWRSRAEKTPSPNILHPEKINIFSSCLVTAEGEHPIGREGPQVLFDEAHAAWFFGMVRDIVAMAQEEHHNRPIAVVIDTSPGFSGLGPNIEEWLTDLGPKRGKFLFVASPDQQDVRACMWAIKRIQDAFAIKLQAAQIFWDAQDPSKSKEALISFQGAEKEQQKFFMRLAKQYPGPQKPGPAIQENTVTPHSLLAWYLDPKAPFQAHLDQPSHSWAVVLNRVHPVLMREPLLGKLPDVIVGTDTSQGKQGKKMKQPNK